MITAEFAQSGFQIRHEGPPPRRVQVFGERSSGTNYVKRLIGRNSVLTPTEELGWKHGPLQVAAIPADVAIVVAVRAPEPWARSMFAKPWHTVPAMQRLGFAEFLRAPWETIVDRTDYFPDAARLDLVGQPLQGDRDPATGAMFANLFALRRAKLGLHLSLWHRHTSVAILRMEEATARPETVLDGLLSGFGLPPRAAELRPVVKRLGAKFKRAVADRPAAPDGLSEADRAFMRAELDPALEAALGYSV